MGSARVAKHVLVVDDYPDMAQTMAILVVESTPMRITTEIGFDGRQAVALATARRPDAALLDIDMPVMDGVDAALAIRVALAPAPPLLIAMTGNATQAHALRTRQAFDRVLRKPVDVDELLALLVDA